MEEAKIKGKRQFSGGEDPFAKALLSWYDENRRILPWREEPGPYHTWLSEIMLQQTRVEAVKGYYARFLAALPEISDLADAEEEKVLKLWEGLGYYSRARNLQKAAKTIMTEYAGEMPKTFQELKKLPGIGEYTAAAIASIVYKEEIPALDGNLLRIFSRLTSYQKVVLEPEGKKLAFSFFQEKMRGIDPGNFNQALMDLGSGVCLPKGEIGCKSCPLEVFCSSSKTGNPSEYPKLPEKKKRKVEQYSIFLIRHREELLLKKRENKGLLAGLYEFYKLEGHCSEKEALEAVESLGLRPIRIKALGEAKHIFTHKEWEMIGYEVYCGDFQGEGQQEGQQEGQKEENSVILRESLIPEESSKAKKTVAKKATAKKLWEKQGYRFYSKEEIQGELSIPSAFAYYKQFL